MAYDAEAPRGPDPGFDADTLAKATRGYDRFDQDFPGWDRDVAPGRLNISDPGSCGLFFARRMHYDAARVGYMNPQELHDHGCYVIPPEPHQFPTQGYLALTHAWRHLLNERRFARYGVTPTPPPTS